MLPERSVRPRGAPPVIHIDVADAVRVAEEYARLGPGHVVPLPTPRAIPPRTPLDLLLLDEAAKCVNASPGDPTAIPPRRPMLAAALLEVERQQHRAELAEARAEAAERQAGELRQYRRELLKIHFELVRAAARLLGCEPSAKAVLARVRDEADLVAGPGGARG